MDTDTRLLILGSLPGDASLTAASYYAHPRNAFWSLIGAVIGVDLSTCGYPARVDALRLAGVGLWDTVARARRVGSLDAAICAAEPNDLGALVARLPRLRAVGFNGATAMKLGSAALAGSVPVLIALPSSSPAYTLAVDRKRAAWLALRAWL